MTSPGYSPPTSTGYGAAQDGLLHRLRCELLECLAGKRPVRVLVIDTFRTCGHARAYNTWVDANGQARCVICRQARRKAA